MTETSDTIIVINNQPDPQFLIFSHGKPVAVEQRQDVVKEIPADSPMKAYAGDYSSTDRQFTARNGMRWTF